MAEDLKGRACLCQGCNVRETNEQGLCPYESLWKMFRMASASHRDAWFSTPLNRWCTSLSLYDGYGAASHSPYLQHELFLQLLEVRFWPTSCLPMTDSNSTGMSCLASAAGAQ